MATLAAVRRAAILSRAAEANRSLQPATLLHRRGLASSSDHHGPAKINIWEDPMSPSKWKEEHFVIASLTGWGLLIYGGYKLATRGKGKKEEKLAEASN